MENKSNYRLKAIGEKDRAALPMEIKVLITMASKPVRGFETPDYLYKDAYTRFPEYFEPFDETQMFIE